VLFEEAVLHGKPTSLIQRKSPSHLLYQVILCRIKFIFNADRAVFPATCAVQVFESLQRVVFEDRT